MGEIGETRHRDPDRLRTAAPLARMLEDMERVVDMLLHTAEGFRRWVGQMDGGPVA
jgi:hypothetical protein